MAPHLEKPAVRAIFYWCIVIELKLNLFSPHAAESVAVKLCHTSVLLLSRSLLSQSSTETADPSLPGEPANCKKRHSEMKHHSVTVRAARRFPRGSSISLPSLTNVTQMHLYLVLFKILYSSFSFLAYSSPP